MIRNRIGRVFMQAFFRRMMRRCFKLLSFNEEHLIRRHRLIGKSVGYEPTE
jgi:hypothetical protein